MWVFWGWVFKVGVPKNPPGCLNPGLMPSCFSVEWRCGLLPMVAAAAAGYSQPPVSVSNYPASGYPSMPYPLDPAGVYACLLICILSSDAPYHHRHTVYK